MSEPILLEKRDGGAFATFNRPEVRNALNPEVIGKLADFLLEIRDDPDVRYLVIQGQGEHFSAGGDVASYGEKLKELGSDGIANYMRRRVRGNAECLYSLEELEIPVIAVVRGAAAGAGVSFILACDFVLAAEDAMLIFAQPKIGLPLDLATSYFLPRVVGVKAARQVALAGATMKAPRAKELGIFDELHPAEALPDALAALIKQFSAVAPRAGGRSKRLINDSLDRNIATQMEEEVRMIGECVAEPDFAEGVAAFLEKRKAQFKGRSR